MSQGFQELIDLAEKAEEEKNKLTREQALLILDNIALKHTESEKEKQAILMAIRCMEKELITRTKAVEMLKELTKD